MHCKLGLVTLTQPDLPVCTSSSSISWGGSSSTKHKDTDLGECISTWWVICLYSLAFDDRETALRAAKQEVSFGESWLVLIGFFCWV